MPRYLFIDHPYPAHHHSPQHHAPYLDPLSASTGMAINKSLPLEIHDEIFSYLPLSDLLRTSTVSHHMCQISQSLLFKDPALTNNVDWTKPSSLQLLLRTLLSPGGGKLAIYVRSLKVRWDEWASPDSRSKVPLVCPSGVCLLGDAAIRFGLDLSLTSKPSQLVLLLYLLPRLSILNIAPPDDGGQTCVVFSEFLEAHSMTQLTETLPPGLQQLSEFRFSSDHTTGRVSPTALLTILKLPRIRKVDVRLKDSSFPFLAAEAATATSTVTHLRLPLTFLDTRSLGSILKIPTGLTHFSYSRALPDRELYITQALRPLQASLQHLHFEWVAVEQPIGSLRGWTALRTLSCSLPLLLGKEIGGDSPRLTDVLPVTLRELVIMREYYWDGTAAADQLEDLVRQKKRVVPELERLVVPFSDSQMWRDEQAKDMLKVVCEGAAVALVDYALPRWDSSFGQFWD